MSDLVPPAGLQADLLTAVARLEQIRDAGGFDAAPYVAERLLTCDLPRLTEHLTAETVAWKFSPTPL